MTDREYPRRDADTWAFEDWVARRGRSVPSATALVDAGTGRRWSYEQLDEAVEETARRLLALGVRPGDHLGTLVGTRVEAVRLVHAAIRIGAVLVPSNATLSPDAVGSQLAAADVTTLVCGAATESLAVEAASGEGGRSVPVASVDPPTEGSTVALADQPPSSAPETVRRPRRGLDAPSMILFTSGTTGDPKPVVLTAGNVLASAVGSAFRLGVSPDDRWLCELPAYHMGGIAPFLRSALYGTTAVVQERTDGFDPDLTMENLHEYGATSVSLVPTQLRRLLQVGELPQSLRFVLLGGGPTPEELVRRCRRQGVPVSPTYGMTETASQMATARPAEAGEYPGTVGRPLAVTDVTLVDDAGEPVETGETGEVVVDGPTVTPGYYGDPSATADAFGPYGLHTGDLAHRDEGGRLWIHGRVDDLIRTGGETVDPATVADAVRSLDGVDDAAVVGVEDPEWGERVAALVVESGGANVTAEAVKAHCRADLADYEVPKSVAFADDLPRTASGTVDRDAVRASVSDPDGGR